MKDHIPCTLIYDKKTDTLNNEKITADKYLFKYLYGDFVYADNIRGTYLLKVKNASKYIKRDILEEMTEDNDYLVDVDRRYGGDLFQVLKFMENVPKITYHVNVYKKVVRMVPMLERELVGSEVIYEDRKSKY